MKLSFQKYVFALLIFTTHTYSASQTNPINEISPLIFEGDVEKIEAFLNSYHSPHKQFLKNYLLADALGSKKPVETVELLLNQKAEVCSSKLVMACHPMPHSIKKGIESTVVGLLLDARADINGKRRGKDTVFKRVVKECFLALIPIPCLLRLLDEPTIELNQDRDVSAFYLLAAARALNATYLPVLEKMLERGADPNTKDGRTGRKQETIYKRYCRWLNPNFKTDHEKADPHVTKSVLLMLKKQISLVKKEQESIKNAVLAASIFPQKPAGIIAEYCCKRIAPNPQELDEALTVYKDVKPATVLDETTDQKEN